VIAPILFFSRFFQRFRRVPRDIRRHQGAAGKLPGIGPNTAAEYQIEEANREAVMPGQRFDHE